MRSWNKMVDKSIGAEEAMEHLNWYWNHQKAWGFMLESHTESGAKIFKKWGVACTSEDDCKQQDSRCYILMICNSKERVLWKGKRIGLQIAMMNKIVHQLHLYAWYYVEQKCNEIFLPTRDLSAHSNPLFDPLPLLVIAIPLLSGHPPLSVEGFGTWLTVSQPSYNLILSIIISHWQRWLLITSVPLVLLTFWFLMTSFTVPESLISMEPS